MKRQKQKQRNQHANGHMQSCIGISRLSRLRKDVAGGSVGCEKRSTTRASSSSSSSSFFAVSGRRKVENGSPPIQVPTHTHTRARAHTAASCFLNSPARSVAHSRRESTQSQNKLVGAHRESTSKRDLMKSESFDQSPMAT